VNSRAVVELQIDVFLISAIVDGVKLHVPVALSPEKEPLGPTVCEDDLTQELILATWRRENTCSYRDSNFDPSPVQSVASRCTSCAIAARNSIMFLIKLRAELKLADEFRDTAI
jgi:hypothetical protein